MLIVYVDVYVSTPLNKWNGEDHWKSMEQDYLFEDLPEFTPPNRNTKRSQKSVASGHPSKRDTNGVCNTSVNAVLSTCNTPGSKRSQRSVAFESPVLPNPKQATRHVRSTRGCVAERDVTGQSCVY